MVANPVTPEALREVGSLHELYGLLTQLELTAGWVDMETPPLWREPHSSHQVAHWRYAECKAAMDSAGRLINTDLAERRNLIMRNPAHPDGVATTKTLVSAYQMILPGEKARSHRHAPHAFRVILDSEGAYSTVDGVKTPMETGDIVLTPGWCWHGHGHDGDAPAYWFDGLDVPLVHLLEPMFTEDHPDGFEEVELSTPDSPLRFTWDGTLKALEDAALDPDGVFGRRIRLDAPDMPTMGVDVQRLDSGESTRRHRSTANRVYVVMQGEGISTIDGTEVDWHFGDTFAAPCWTWIEHKASSDTVLFSMTDEPLMRFARYWRFEAEE